MSGNSLRARLIRGGLGSAGVQAANRLLALGMGVVLARLLGPEDYGIYAYAFAVMGLLMVMAEAGVPTLLMRQVAASQGRAEWGLLRGALRRGMQFVALVATTVSLLGLLVLWYVADTLRPEVLYTTALMLLVLPVTALCKTVAHAIRGLHRVVIGQAVDMLIRPLLVLIIVAVVFLAWPGLRKPHIAMAAQLFGALVVLLVGALVLRRFLPHESLTAVPAYESRKWLRSALNFVLIGGAGIINSQTDIIMLGWFMSPSDVGIYRVAVQGATVLQFAMHVAGNVSNPALAQFYSRGDYKNLTRLVITASRVVVAVTIPMVLVIGVFGQEIIEAIFGSDYAPASGPLTILAFGQLVNIVFSFSGYVLNMSGNEKLAAIALLISAVINVFGNAVMIPLWGISGAALATATSTALLGVLFYIACQNTLNVRMGFWVRQRG